MTQRTPSGARRRTAPQDSKSKSHDAERRGPRRSRKRRRKSARHVEASPDPGAVASAVESGTVETRADGTVHARWSARPLGDAPDGSPAEAPAEPERAVVVAPVEEVREPAVEAAEPSERAEAVEPTPPVEATASATAVVAAPVGVAEPSAPEPTVEVDPAAAWFERGADAAASGEPNDVASIPGAEDALGITITRENRRRLARIALTLAGVAAAIGLAVWEQKPPAAPDVPRPSHADETVRADPQRWSIRGHEATSARPEAVAAGVDEPIAAAPMAPTPAAPSREETPVAAAAYAPPPIPEGGAPAGPTVTPGWQEVEPSVSAVVAAVPEPAAPVVAAPEPVESEPGAAAVAEPEPAEVAVAEPEPAAAVEPAPAEVAIAEPEPVEVAVAEPEPAAVAVAEPEAAAVAPAPAAVAVAEPEPAAAEPAPAEVAVAEPEPAAAVEPAPAEVAVAEPEPVEVAVAEPEPAAAVEPAPVEVAVAEPEPESAAAPEPPSREEALGPNGFPVGSIPEQVAASLASASVDEPESAPTRRRPRARRSNPSSAEEWVAVARHLEARAPRDAIYAYARAATHGYAPAYKAMARLRARLGDRLGTLMAYRRYLATRPWADDAPDVQQKILALLDR